MAGEDKAILSVQFAPDAVTITWLDADGVTPRVKFGGFCEIDPELCKEDVDDVLGTLQDMLTKAHVERRNPPESFTAPR